MLVAETIMKKLYVRNKELEDFHQHSNNQEVSENKHSELSEQIRNNLIM